MWMPLLILAGCAAFDSERADAILYIQAVQPLMAENSLLAERTLAIASTLHDGSATDASVLEGWTTEIVPLSQHLHLQAARVDVPETWTDLHGELVGIWTERTIAYRDLGEGVVLADTAIWERAKNRHQAAIDREQAWFQTVSTQLAAHELMLEQYP